MHCLEEKWEPGCGGHPHRFSKISENLQSRAIKGHSLHTVVFCRSAKSNLEYPTAHRNGNRMGPIIGLKFIHEIFDVEVNGSLRNR